MLFAGEGATDEAGGAAAAAAAEPEEDDSEESAFSRLSEDDKLLQCFLYALKKKIKVTQLPMLTSGFYRDCVQVCVYV